MNNYSSYLVRHWLLADEASKQRFEEKSDQFQVFDVEHVESGRRTRVQDLTDAMSWIESLTAEKTKTKSE